MKIIELDLTGCKYVYDIHEKIRIAFGFDDGCGHNWDAFWDMLWSECDADKVVIKGEKSLSDEFNKDISIFHEILERNKKERESFGWSFDYQIID